MSAFETFQLMLSSVSDVMLLVVAIGLALGIAAALVDLVRFR